MGYCARKKTSGASEGTMEIQICAERGWELLRVLLKLDRDMTQKESCQTTQLERMPRRRTPSEPVECTEGWGAAIK